MNQSFGQTILAGRKDICLSQRKVAIALGVDCSYISRLENDCSDYPPSLDLINRIAKLYSLDANLLLSLSGRIPPEGKQIFLELHKLYGDRFTDFLRKMHDNNDFAKSILEEAKS